MVQTKTTPRRSDAKGNLPPLGRARHSDTRWGTAQQTFHKRFQLPLDPVRQDVSYKGMSNRSNTRMNLNTLLMYCTVEQVINCGFLLTQGCLPPALVLISGSTSPLLGEGGGGQAPRLFGK